MDWAKPDTAAEPPGHPGRLAERWAAPADRWTFASGLARAGITILVAVAVFVAVFKSLDGFGHSVEDVKPPTIVKTTPVAPEPTIAPAKQVSKLPAWWLRPPEFQQSFAATDIATPGELCGRLAELGYGAAKWRESQLFKGEWECFSDLDSEDPRSRSFLVLRGSPNEASRLMLRLTAADESARDPLIAKAGEVVELFAEATGLVLAPDALPLLREWRAGGTWTSKGTVRIVAEAGRDATRVLTIAATPPLPSPSGDACRTACRTWAASFGTAVVAARPVKSTLRALP